MAAVGTERISAVVGYVIKAGNFALTSPNLPVKIAVLCEANTANQGTLDLTPWQATSLKAVGQRYGYGSPAYLIASVDLPQIGGIPLVFFPQAAAVGATSKKIHIAATGTATGNAEHTFIIGGRDNIAGFSYTITVNTGDTAADIHDKIADKVNSVLGAPVLASSTDYYSLLETKWKGATADDLDVAVTYADNKDVGITYAITSVQSGAGTPDIGDALALFGDEWYTHVINSYGLNDTVMSALEAFNGVPDDNNPTGRYAGLIMKPFVAFSGTLLDDPSSITDSHKEEVTICPCPAPGVITGKEGQSTAFAFEVAASWCANSANLVQNTPELDTLNAKVVDVPAPTNIGSMTDYNERDRIVKLGCSTVQRVGTNYQIKDMVTTFHPDGDNAPVFRYVRDLYVMFNIRYGYYLMERDFLVGSVIVADGAPVNNSPSGKIVSPSIWKSNVLDYIKQLEGRALVVDPDFTKASLTVAINNSNSNRLDTRFSTKLTGIVRISATENIVGFNFG